MALRYYVAGSGGTNNFGTTGAGSNWSLSDGGPGGQTPPTVADDIQITSNSPTLLIIDTTARACKSITAATAWVGTIQMDQNLSVSGVINLESQVTVTGIGKLEALVAATHVIDTYIPVLGLRGAVTHSFGSLGVVRCGNFFFGSTTNATVVNSATIEIAGDLDLSLNSTAILSGTALLKMTGTGQVKYPTSTGVLRNNLTIDTSGTVTFATGTFRYNTGTLTYTAGTVAASGCDLAITAATTLNTGANVVFGTINISGTTTVTLNANLYASGLTQLGGTTLTTTINGSDLYCGGGLTINGTTAVITGTSKIRLTGTGTLTVNTTTSVHAVDIYIDAGAGTVTTAGTIRYPFNRFKYVSGTVVTSAGTWATAGSTNGATLLMGGTGQTGIGVF